MEEKYFVLDFSLRLEIENEISEYIIISGTRIPIPVCNENATFTLPGDGSIEGFVKAVGETVGQTAIEIVLRQLGLQVIL